MIEEKKVQLKDKIVEIVEKLRNNNIPQSVIEDFLNKIIRIELLTLDELTTNSKKEAETEIITIKTKEKYTREQCEYVIEINPSQQKYEIQIENRKYSTGIPFRPVETTSISKKINTQQDKIMISTSFINAREVEEQNGFLALEQEETQELYDATGVEIRSEAKSKLTEFEGKINNNGISRYPNVPGTVTISEKGRMAPDITYAQAKTYQNTDLYNPIGEPEIVNVYSKLRGERGSLASFHQSLDTLTEEEAASYYITQDEFEKKTQYDSPEQKQRLIRWVRKYNLSTGKSR